MLNISNFHKNSLRYHLALDTVTVIKRTGTVSADKDVGERGHFVNYYSPVLGFSRGAESMQRYVLQADLLEWRT